MDKDIVKYYDKEGFRIVWRPAKCIHSEICVKTLPKVYRPGEKPWIRPEAASVEALKDQIGRCPSGALAYDLGPVDEAGTSQPETVQISVQPKGPLLVKGSISLKTADGAAETHQGSTAFCRCGASSRKPFCDGSHKKIDFE
jgi:uncharacterized Fe-S cluster protein YjdI